MLERSQFLDANVESAKMMTVLASLLAESGAHKRADTLLRQALELFWRELKDPTPAVARCYRVRLPQCTTQNHLRSMIVTEQCCREILFVLCRSWD